MVSLARSQIIVLIIAWVQTIGMTGCSAKRAGAGSGFASPTPSERLNATREAAVTSDWQSIPALIMGLESDDAAIRFMSAGTLNRLTGKQLGYRHDASPQDRRASVERWMRAWESGSLAPFQSVDASDDHLVDDGGAGEFRP